MKIGSLCTGYGGLDHGVQAVYGGETVWVSDIDKGARKILAHRYRGIPNLGDFTTTDWTTVEPVDVLTAGYPCQPFSHAGQRKGTTDDRHIWPHVREAIRCLRPRLTLLENVAGHRSLGFDRVLGDLAEDGMHVRWTSLRAADIGAPHGRERLFIAVTRDTHGTGLERRGESERPHERAPRATGLGHPLLPTPVADNSRGLPSSGTDYASLPNVVFALLPTPTSSVDSGGLREDGTKYGPTSGVTLTDAVLRADRLLPTPKTSDGEWGLPRTSGRPPERSTHLATALKFNPWGVYSEAIARWEHTIGRPAPNPTQTSAKGTQHLAPAFVEWMMGLPAGHVTQVPELTRNEQLKALGNGVVPQQAAAALHMMAQQ